MTDMEITKNIKEMIEDAVDMAADNLRSQLLNCPRSFPVYSYAVVGYDEYNHICFAEYEGCNEAEVEWKARKERIINIRSIEKINHDDDAFCEEPIYK